MEDAGATLLLEVSALAKGLCVCAATIKQAQWGCGKHKKNEKKKKKKNDQNYNKGLSRKFAIKKIMKK